MPVRFLSFSNDSALCADAVRSYTKNRLVRTLSPSVNLFVGDYAASNRIEDLADQSEGIRRVAICRMDVDNLGQAFLAGFEQPDQTDPVQRMKYVNLFRAAAFSRQMSLFFKYHINGLLQGLRVSIVYAGGDDVFLVGAWNHTLQAALRIQKHLRSYTCGALTISAGIAMFNEHYPIRAASTSPAELSTVERKAVKKLAWIPASKFDRYTASLHSGTYPLDELDQSILNRYAHPITKDALLEAIAEFSHFYQDAFLSHFPQGHPVANIPDTPHLILGGGTGFLSKTVGYPYLKDDYAAALFKSRCSCSMHPCRHSYRVGPSH